MTMRTILDWVKRSKSNVFLHTGQSDQDILEIQELTHSYLEDNQGIVKKINEVLWVYRAVIDLPPQTLENAASGHTFPISESQFELESSIQLCKLGFYKHAIIALRNVLELGLLSVYWDIDGKSHINIPEWLSSNERTPFRKEIIKVLKKNERIIVFDKEHNIFMQITELYYELSDFSHTKGVHFSAIELSRGNVNTFNRESIGKWLDFMERVVTTVITIHILQYPVGLQNIDLFSKFGFNPPAGGFLRPSDVERVRNFLDEGVVESLQTISDADPEARSISQEINSMPDKTNKEIDAQLEEREKSLIKLHPLGYQGWIRDRKKWPKIDKKAYKIKRQRWKKLKKWAKANGCYNERDRDPPPTNL